MSIVAQKLLMFCLGMGVGSIVALLIWNRSFEQHIAPRIARALSNAITARIADGLSEEADRLREKPDSDPLRSLAGGFHAASEWVKWGLWKGEKDPDEPGDDDSKAVPK